MMTINNQETSSSLRICAITSGVIMGLGAVGGLIAALVVTNGRTINGQPAPSLPNPCINVTSIPYFSPDMTTNNCYGARSFETTTPTGININYAIAKGCGTPTSTFNYLNIALPRVINQLFSDWSTLDNQKCLNNSYEFAGFYLCNYTRNVSTCLNLVEMQGSVFSTLSKVSLTIYLDQVTKYTFSGNGAGSVNLGDCSLGGPITFQNVVQPGLVRESMVADIIAGAFNETICPGYEVSH